MNRRELLKAAGSVIVSGKTVMLRFELEPVKHVVFFDRKLMGSDFPETAIRPTALPDGRIAQGFPSDTIFYPVEVPRGKTLDDAIRIYAES